ncbi:MAG: CoA-binding protein [Pseudomonadota bacterium]
MELEKFFKPDAIAIVGVSKGDYRFGGLSYLEKLIQCGFSGPLYPINPKGGEIMGRRIYPDLASLPTVPDLCLVCVAAARVPGVLEECGRIGARRIHILTSGFKELGTPQGRELEERIADLAARHGLLVLGPNCMGPYCPSGRQTAWGAIPGRDGNLGLISQSGGMVQRLTEYAAFLGVGISKAVSFGNATVLKEVDFLEHLGQDPPTKLIAMYLESVSNGPKFLSLAAGINRQKPIILLKGGESRAGAVTAASHTGALAGNRAVWEGAVRQAGLTAVGSLDEWMDAISVFSFLPPARGRKVFVIGGGGGNSVCFSDICSREGLAVPRLSAGTMDLLRKIAPQAGSIAGNPLDLWQVFTDAGFLIDILEAAFDDPVVDLIVVDRLIPRDAFHMPNAPNPTPEIIAYLKGKRDRKPVVFVVDSEGGDPDLAARGASLRAEFGLAGLPALASLPRAARALAHFCRHHLEKDEK